MFHLTKAAGLQVYICYIVGSSFHTYALTDKQQPSTLSCRNGPKNIHRAGTQELRTVCFKLKLTLKTRLIKSNRLAHEPVEKHLTKYTLSQQLSHHQPHTQRHAHFHAHFHAPTHVLFLFFIHNNSVAHTLPFFIEQTHIQLQSHTHTHTHTHTHKRIHTHFLPFSFTTTRNLSHTLARALTHLIAHNST